MPIETDSTIVAGSLVFVTHRYEAKKDDELTLYQGDQLQVLKVYPDGWAVASHKLTGKEGVIPLVCVSMKMVY